MNLALRLGALVLAVGLPTILVMSWASSAGARMEAAAAAEDGDTEVAVATASDAGYCSLELKKILRRVLQSCGLIGKKGTRGCQPLEAKAIATLAGDDFNALFAPMRDRGGIIQFDSEQSDLDESDRELVSKVFADQRGASYFFVVARASPEGEVAYNRELSKRRAESVMGYLTDTFQDPDLEKEVGLLWLGEEFAQLDADFCEWRRSGDPDSCRTTDINRGAFVAWIDCTL